MQLIWKLTARTILIGMVLLILSLGSPPPGKATVVMEACKDLAFSTSEDFITRGPIPGDGNPIISDGDLLGANCAICARNADLLAVFEIDAQVDLGLDAVDVIAVDDFLVAFSTELDSPNVGQFKAGDLLTTNHVVIPNQALTYAFGQGAIRVDLGLDGIHFVGGSANILGFLDAAVQYGREDWLRTPDLLTGLLEEFQMDIWFSTEGTAGPVERPLFLDGDVLSAATGLIVASNDVLLPTTVPAGIPSRGVDFGLDGLTGARIGAANYIHFSTELLFSEDVAFTDGDVLQINNGVIYTNDSLTGCFEPLADMLGLDALYLGGIMPETYHLPLIQKY